MGDKSERLVYPFLERDCNSKVAAPLYKNIFDMQSEKNFVTDAVCITVTPAQQQFIEHLFSNAQDYHHYLVDALERATHFCELDLEREQLRQDYLLMELAKKLLNVSNQSLTTYKA